MPLAQEPWYSTTLNVWSLAATLVATITLTKTVTAAWRASFGRRHHVISRIRKVAPWVSPDYVEELFGEPAWVNSLTVHQYQGETPVPEKDLAVELTKRTWKLGRFGYLVTWSTENAVQIYGITTTSRRFRPRLLVNGTRVKLGRTRLATLQNPGNFWSWIGARRFTYIESHYGGNPGGYRTWYVGVNDIGHFPMAPVGMDETSEAEREAFRSVARINTVIVSTALYREVSDATVFGNSFGPDQDQIRLLEPEMRLVHSWTDTARIRWNALRRSWNWRHKYAYRRYGKALDRARGNTAKP
ncbi:ETEC_3214 domain-containing protein [Streptomyces sp. NPDC021012]|uniref:ETEC_3214 domain-containing protein n=1 Tax=Streptomyces sp. NPDC021012 TaxID=3365107 RepID=UPI0037A44469